MSAAGSLSPATRHPDVVRRLVLMEANIPGVTPESAFGLANAAKVQVWATRLKAAGNISGPLLVGFYEGKNLNWTSRRRALTESFRLRMPEPVVSLESKPCKF